MKTHEPDTRAHRKPDGPPQGDLGHAQDKADTFMEYLLGQGTPEGGQRLAEAEIASWAQTRGMLTDGRTARGAASCLLRPAVGDTVLVWASEQCTWVLAVLSQADRREVVLASEQPIAIRAPRVAMAARAVHIAAGELLTSARNRHIVEDVRTIQARTRVSRIGTDIRRVTTADECVEATLLQRAGTWISATVRDARLRARTFLFD